MLSKDQLIEQLSEKVHNSWWDEKRSQGFHAPLECEKYFDQSGKFKKFCDKCHTDMYPYNELSNNIQEYDRVTVRTVLNALEELGYDIR